MSEKKTWRFVWVPILCRIGLHWWIYSWPERTERACVSCGRAESKLPGLRYFGFDQFEDPTEVRERVGVRR